jgi:hypothetical protein
MTWHLFRGKINVDKPPASQQLLFMTEVAKQITQYGIQKDPDRGGYRAQFWIDALPDGRDKVRTLHFKYELDLLPNLKDVILEGHYPDEPDQPYFFAKFWQWKPRDT